MLPSSLDRVSSNILKAGYGYYHFSGAKRVVDTASSTKKQFQKLTQNIQDKAPEPNEALKWLRSTATSYAAFIPGAKTYVDSAFNDLDAVSANHGDEVEEIVQNAYKELKEATKSGMSIETATKSWEIVEKTISQLSSLASDSMGEILDNHPDLKEKVGGNIDQLKKLAENGGEDVKKELQKTYQQISDIIKGGVSAESIDKVKKLIQEKTEKLQSLGDEAWKKGMEQAKPYLDKSPQVKKIIEENADSLKSGNFSEILQKVKDAVSSGNTEDLQKWVKEKGEQAKDSGMGQSLEKYVKMIPGGSEIFPKLQKLQEVAKKHGDEAEKIMKGAYEDVQKVLEKRIGEAEKLGEKAKKDSKK
jgi:hypothetical protein